jgi:hypothetical protein
MTKAGQTMLVRRAPLEPMIVLGWIFLGPELSSLRAMFEFDLTRRGPWRRGKSP